MSRLLSITQAAGNVLRDHRLLRVEALHSSWLVYCKCGWQVEAPKDQAMDQLAKHVEEANAPKQPPKQS